MYRKPFKYLLAVTWWKGLCEMAVCKGKALNFIIHKVPFSAEYHFYFSLEVACTKESFCKRVKIFGNTFFHISHISQMKAYFCSVLHYCWHQQTHKHWWTSGWAISLFHSAEQSSLEVDWSSEAPSGQVVMIILHQHCSLSSTNKKSRLYINWYCCSWSCY